MKIAFAPLVVAGLVAAAAAPAAAQTYDGPYVGVTAGYNSNEIHTVIDGTPVATEVSRDSFILGGYAGYNFRASDAIVIGAEAGLTTTTSDLIVANSSGEPLVADPRYSFDLSARAGYRATDETLVYLRGGYANQRVGTTSDEFTRSENLDGWQIGGGFEIAITDHMSGRVEYRYSDFGQDGGGFNRHQGLFGVSYNF